MRWNNVTLKLLFFVSPTGQPAENHIIINRKSETSYITCPITKHFVTVTPSHRIEKNTLEFSDAYSFACYTTCRGGINRRSVAILFALYIKYVFIQYSIFSKLNLIFLYENVKFLKCSYLKRVNAGTVSLVKK